MRINLECSDDSFITPAVFPHESRKFVAGLIEKFIHNSDDHVPVAFPFSEKLYQVSPFPLNLSHVSALCLARPNEHHSEQKPINFFVECFILSTCPFLAPLPFIGINTLSAMHHTLATLRNVIAFSERSQLVRCDVQRK